jgi:lipopolysaccharide cholinephosphotransferase
LQTWESDSEYGLAFAKVRENNTVYKEKGAGISKAHNGFYVDVFPYDVYPQKFSQRKKQGSCYYIIRRMILSKCGYRPWSAEKNSLKKVAKHICYLPIEFVSCFISKEKLINTYLNTCTAYNNYYTGFVYEQAGAAHYGKWVLPSECFDEYIALKFEDTEFNCPAKYDLYLSSVYGDYMKLPPEEQRENRHQIVEIVFADR